MRITDRELEISMPPRSSFFALLVSIAVSLLWQDRAKAECAPTDFMLQDGMTTSTSPITTEIAIALTATKEQFDKAKQAGFFPPQGLIGGSATFDEARAKASRLSQGLRLSYDSSYWAAFFAQELSQPARQSYVDCIKQARSGPRLILWVNNRQGDFLIVGAVWFGANGQQTGTYDQDPVVAPSTVTIVQKPPRWNNGVTEQIILQKSSAVDALLSISVSGQNAALVLVRDPPPIVIATQEVIGPKLSVSSFHVSGTVCGASSAEDCVTPKQPGGYLMRGSGKLKNYSARISSSAGFSVTVDTPDRICIKLTVSTGACEAQNIGQGVITAIEQYPMIPQ